MTVTDEQFIDAIDKAHVFYAEAFSNLLLITFGIVAFVGVILPIVISIIQSKQLKSENKTLRQELEEHASQLTAAKFKEIQKELEEKERKFESHLDAKLGELKARIGRLTDESTGSVFHLQGNSSLKERQYESATGSYCIAIRRYLSAENFADMRIVCRILCEKCLPNLDKDKLKDETKILDGIDKAYKLIRDKNKNGTFSDLISSIEEQLSLYRKKDQAKPKIDSDSASGSAEHA
ncbi:hypothetical protein FNZ56_10770 [Pseudoluteimonas lycopersici]|uniref:Uncharacterized protein n=1 Tax=Pseudoluteimonas lycopersici TaxID=1324796 RepID=A0A516V740_9GAMM|nr:hypothetical protein [Lysobacter lycopersici]QDQ74328.1 hypothetical protein FNZ56_10770 [Lysobacter lycopersici]